MAAAVRPVAAAARPVAVQEDKRYVSDNSVCDNWDRLAGKRRAYFSALFQMF